MGRLNLGLGEGSALPVGVPVPYPLATPPTGWFNCNGAIFDKAQYPKLALVYPSGTLPDLRGEFIRGWDNGRGVDSGRVLYSIQGDAIRNLNGSIYNVAFVMDTMNGVTSGVFSNRGLDECRWATNTAGKQWYRNIDFSASNMVPTANENRPRNISFNYILRAA